MLDVMTGIVRRTRQNHGLEHATIHLLAPRARGKRISGYSDPWGFTVFGDVTQPQVQQAASDALLRLQSGETQLAIHPNCGTNLFARAVLATLAALLAQFGRRGGGEQVARTLLFMVPALLIGEPVGYRLQEYTTSSQVADRWIVDVQRMQLGPVVVHRVRME